jgi:hypothetical protein
VSQSYRNSLLLANTIEPVESGFRASKYIVSNLIKHGGEEFFMKISDSDFLKKKEFQNVTID